VRRVALLALVALSLVAGTAKADVFQVVPTSTTAFVPPPPAVPEQLDSAQLLGLWQGAGAEYGVPWQVLAAINKVESNFGRNMGPSSAGAVGWMQFMPSTWMAWGVDASGDGVADPWNAADAIYSAARYLAAAGAPNDLYRAVFAYNHADWYVQEVLAIAQLYGTDQTVAFSVDQMQQQLDAARHAVAVAGDRVAAAAKEAAALQRRADRTTLLSDRLPLEQKATLAAIRRDAAARALKQARRELTKAQQASKAAAFNPTVGGLLGGPSYEAGYVFPVGGGAGVVSASHSHHDYPAVDIAAPLGEPVYALASSVVVRAWSEPDPRCGIGLTLQAYDGQTWTYCHLAVLDPSVVPGAALSAGQQVGLVGQTGDATGPHLHLQLQPATAWPQQEAWFQGFAGSAFTWQDGPDSEGSQPTTAVRGLAMVVAPQAAPVFQVVPAQSQGVVLFSRG
jgi:murein DD-endopeptidase MepM/ murein hydrolase activator NlpD